MWLQWVGKGLMVLSIASAVVASLSRDTYTARTPKRLFLQHIVRGSEAGAQTAVFAAASSDATPIDVVLEGMDLQPAEADGQEWRVSTCQRVKRHGCAFNGLHLFHADLLFVAF